MKIYVIYNIEDVGPNDLDLDSAIGNSIALGFTFTNKADAERVMSEYFEADEYEVAEFTLHPTYASFEADWEATVGANEEKGDGDADVSVG